MANAGDGERAGDVAGVVNVGDAADVETAGSPAIPHYCLLLRSFPRPEIYII